MADAEAAQESSSSGSSSSSSSSSRNNCATEGFAVGGDAALNAASMTTSSSSSSSAAAAAAAAAHGDARPVQAGDSNVGLGNFARPPSTARIVPNSGGALNIQAEAIKQLPESAKEILAQAFTRFQPLAPEEKLKAAAFLRALAQQNQNKHLGSLNTFNSVVGESPNNPVTCDTRIGIESNCDQSNNTSGPLDISKLSPFGPALSLGGTALQGFNNMPNLSQEQQQQQQQQQQQPVPRPVPRLPLRPSWKEAAVAVATAAVVATSPVETFTAEKQKQEKERAKARRVGKSQVAASLTAEPKRSNKAKERESWRRKRCEEVGCDRVSFKYQTCLLHRGGKRCVQPECDKLVYIGSVCLAHCPKDGIAGIKQPKTNRAAQIETALNKQGRSLSLSHMSLMAHPKGSKIEENAVVGLIAPTTFSALRDTLLSKNELQIESGNVAKDQENNDSNLGRVLDEWKPFSLLQTAAESSAVPRGEEAHKSMIGVLQLTYRRILSKLIQHAIFKSAVDEQEKKDSALVVAAANARAAEAASAAAAASAAGKPPITRTSKVHDHLKLLPEGFTRSAVGSETGPNKNKKYCLHDKEGKKYRDPADALKRYTPQLALQHAMPFQDAVHFFDEFLSAEERQTWERLIEQNAENDTSRQFQVRLTDYKTIRKLFGVNATRIRLTENEYIIATLPMVIDYCFSSRCTRIYLSSKRVDLVEIPRELLMVMSSHSMLPADIMAKLKRNPVLKPTLPSTNAAPAKKPPAKPNTNKKASENKKSKPEPKKRKHAAKGKGVSSGFYDIEYKKVYTSNKRRRRGQDNND